MGVDPPCREGVGATQVARLECYPTSVTTFTLVEFVASSFICTRYGAWVHEKPLWFTADLIARIPNDFIPKRYLDALDQAAGGQRRSTVDMGTAELLSVPAVPAVPSRA